MRVLSHFFDSAVCQHRITLPLRHLSRDFPQHQFRLAINCYPGDWSWFYLSGRCSPEALPQIAAQKAKGTRFVWGIDDDVLHVPEWNRYRPQTEYEHNLYYLIRDCADLIVTSTPHLASVVDRPTKTVVAPNLADLTPYADPATPAEVEPGKPLRVLWSGSDTHVQDCDLVVDAVKHCLKRFGKGVEFYFFGYCPPDLLRDCLGNGVYYHDWVDLPLYCSTLARIRPHVVLAPMVDDLFNRSKSPIRIFEAWSLSAAVVSSWAGEYKLIRNGVDGEYATDSAEWCEKLDLLLTNHEYRNRLACAGRERVEREYNWDRAECRKPWQDLVRRLELGCG